MSTNRSTRRDLLKNVTQAGLSLAAGQTLAPFAAARPAETVKVGILHSLTGVLAVSESRLRDAELLAIEEINKAGGVLGRKIVPIVEDPESKFIDLFPEKAKKLLLKDKVVAVFGCWTSVSRKMVLPVFEENNGLLFYPVCYEGNEASKNVVYNAAVPGQHVLPALEWLLSKAGGARKKIYLLGSDYIYPRTVNLVATRFLKTKELVPIAEKYVPIGHRDFAASVLDIKRSQPDVIVSAILGASNLSLFNELAAAGLTADRLPVLSLSIDEDDLRAVDPEKFKGHLVAANYFQSLDTPANKRFVASYKQKYGKDNVTTDAIESAYAQVFLWKLACEKAKSFDVDKVRAALSGLEFDAPGGKIKVDEKNQHVWKKFRFGRINKERQIDVVFESAAWLKPDPFQLVKEGN